MGSILRLQSKHKEASLVIKEHVDKLITRYGNNDSTTIQAHVNLADTYMELKMFEAAQIIYESRLPQIKTMLGAENPYAMNISRQLTLAYTMQNKLVEAINVMKEYKPLGEFGEVLTEAYGGKKL